MKAGLIFDMQIINHETMSTEKAFGQFQGSFNIQRFEPSMSGLARTYDANAKRPLNGVGDRPPTELPRPHKCNMRR
ncbi:MAG: hypothetical protein BGP25_04960 [Lysobacterales bacterium 63-13]|nr:MAG: hypothetical protein BGP25_04960 [Xanthomonadales bacterium 63-13]